VLFGIEELEEIGGRVTLCGEVDLSRVDLGQCVPRRGIGALGVSMITGGFER
jgi:hypothetical protein